MQVVRQQLREMSITSQSRPGSSRPSMTLPPGRSPLSITASSAPLGLTHLPKASQTNLPSALSPNKPNLAQPSSPWKLGLGSTPPLHPTSPARVPPGLTLPQSPNSLPAGVLTSPVQRTPPGKGGLRWGGKWGHSRSPGQGGPDSPIQSTGPSRSWGVGWGSPCVQSSSPSRNWEGSGGFPLVQSSSPSQNWMAAGSDSGVPSSGPSKFWGGAATPPVQSSAPSFLKGWLQKQRGHSVIEEQAMEVLVAINQSVNQSINQSSNQSINQISNQSINQWPYMAVHILHIMWPNHCIPAHVCDVRLASALHHRISALCQNQAMLACSMTLQHLQHAYTLTSCF